MQESTKCTPFVAMFQRMARLPIDITEDQFADPDERLAHYQSNAVEEIVIEERSNLLCTIKANIEKAQAKQKRLYDANHGAGISFQVGSFVMKKDFTRKKRRGGKLDPKWVGPFQITAVLGKGLYSLKSYEGDLTKSLLYLDKVTHLSL